MALDLRFVDHLGYYVPVRVSVDLAGRARALLGERSIRRVGKGTYRIEPEERSEDGFRAQGYYVNVHHMECTCPVMVLKHERFCKHLVLCRWLEDVLGG